MNITSTGIATALAVIVALAFLMFGPNIITQPTSPEQLITTDPMNQDQDISDPSLAASAAGAAPATLEGGLQVKDLVVGTGAEATPGSLISVDYVGQLTNGTTFDSSEGRGPFTFTLGAGEVIAGWDQGVAGMKVGGKRLLVIPPELAYGSQDLGVIPSNSTLVFAVTLLSVTPPAP